MQLAVILLASLWIAQQGPGETGPVKYAPFKAHPVNQVLFAEETTLVYDLEFVDPNSNVNMKQRLSMLLSSHPDNAAGQFGGVNFRLDVGRIELKPGTIAVCHTENVHRFADGEGGFREHEPPAVAAPQQVEEEFRLFHPWWLIVFEDLEIGADGTELYVATWPTDTQVEGRIIVALRDGGPIRVRHRQLTGNIMLPNINTHYDITWTSNPISITINGVQQNPGNQINATPAPWPDPNDIMIQQIDQTIGDMNVDRMTMKDAPGMRLTSEE